MDTKGRAIELGRSYVVALNSQATKMDAVRIEGGVRLMDGDRRLHEIDLLMEGGYTIYRYADWIAQQGRQRLYDTVMDIQERAASTRGSLEQLERELKEVLFAGSDTDTSDTIMNFIWGGHGTVEQIIASVPVSAGVNA